MPKDHSYSITIEWTGNLGEGTKDYRAYSRNHEVRAAGKSFEGSSDPAFRGDPSRFNPEELLFLPHVVGPASLCRSRHRRHQLFG
ncbi:MAG: hypothetical protein JNL62_20770 [Bryobacterales bacterium]|nr:hypothetical protein [Bryobacterales bacterium]